MAQVSGAGPVGARGFAPGAVATALAERLEAEHDRWFLWLPVLFGAGIAVYFALPVEPRGVVAILPAVAAVALHAAGPRAGITGLVTAAILAVTLGISAVKLRTEWVRAPVITARMGPVDVNGYVVRIEPRATGGQRVTLRVTGMGRGDAATWPSRVRVRLAAESGALQPGDHVRIRATLNPPPGPALPGGYDFARSAWFMGLGAVGYARTPAERFESAGDTPLSLRITAAIARCARPSAGACWRPCRGRPGRSPMR